MERVMIDLQWNDDRIKDAIYDEIKDNKSIKEDDKLEIAEAVTNYVINVVKPKTSRSESTYVSTIIMMHCMTWKITKQEMKNRVEHMKTLPSALELDEMIEELEHDLKYYPDW